MNHPRPPVLALLAAVVAGGCGSRSRAPAPVVEPPPTSLRVLDDETRGSGDALAANLLIATGTPLLHGGRPAFMIRDAHLERRVAFHAVAHVEAVALGGGAGGGAAVDGSVRIRRLAADPTAPRDGNGNGTNLDEVAGAELRALAVLSGGEVPPALYGAMMPWRRATADLIGAAAPVDRRDFGALRVRPAGLTRLEVDDDHLGAALQARLHLAARLLEFGRGSRPGADADSGLVGLLLLQQVVALEETVLQDLFGRDGSVSGLGDPRRYAPPTPAEAKWMPRRVQVLASTSLPGAPEAYAVVDRASSLEGLAAILQFAAELSWMASDRNPNPTLRDLVTGQPFGEPPGRRRGRGLAALPFDLSGEEVSFSRDIKPLVQQHCIACHNDVSPTSGYTMGSGRTLIAEYQKVIDGGNVGAQGNPPNVTSGDHRNSLLWQVLAGTTGRVLRMPQGCGSVFYPCLPVGQIALFADWIDQGLLRDPTTPVPPPRLGEDLARVLLRNLVLLHLDGNATGSDAGALHDRYDGDAASGVVRARSTGAALQALAVAVRALPPDPALTDLLATAAAFAAKRLVDGDGTVHAELRLAAPGGAGPPADLIDHCALTAGLFAAARVIGSPTLAERAQAAAARLLQAFVMPGAGLLAREPGGATAQLTAGELAIVLQALQEVAATDAMREAAELHDHLLRTLLPVLVASEWDGFGEVLGDGIADTDGNGIAEPALAGTGGRAPVFLGGVIFGPAAERPQPVSWSEAVRPLFARTCSGCHVDGAAMGGYQVDTPTLARRAGESGRAGQIIVPGDPEASLLYRKLVDRVPPVGQQMPLQRPPLEERGRELVRRWILEGALDR